MLRFTKESDLERIKRLKESIIFKYIDNENTNELLVSEADLEFLVENAEIGVLSKNGKQNVAGGITSANDISPIEMPNDGSGSGDGYPF